MAVVPDDRPQVTAFTTSTHPRLLDDCLHSLIEQTFADWEWVVVLHQGARWRPAVDEPRIHLIVEDAIAGGGAAKRLACSVARGEILVELDDSGQLSPDALASLVGAFAERPETGVAYSDHALVPEGMISTRPLLNPADGWDSYEVDVDGRRSLVARAFDPSPHNVSTATYAPRHVLAFRRSAYERAGGYDASATELESHDLTCRLYQHAAFNHVPRCLYFERAQTDLDSTQTEARAGLATNLYDRHVQPNALAWAARQGLLALDLGAAHNKPAGYLGVDQYPGDDVDIVGDVTTGVDLPDSSVGVIRAVDFLEHVPNKVAMFNELYRLLAHGGMLLSLTPSTDGRGAFQDPTHVAPYNENSFWYFTDHEYRALRSLDHVPLPGEPTPDVLPERLARGAPDPLCMRQPDRRKGRTAPRGSAACLRCRHTACSSPFATSLPNPAPAPSSGSASPPEAPSGSTSASAAIPW